MSHSFRNYILEQCVFKEWTKLSTPVSVEDNALETKSQSLRGDLGCPRNRC